MSTHSSSSLGARFENNKSLVSAIKVYANYDPTSAEIQPGAYEQFIQVVDSQMLPYKNALGAVSTAAKENNAVFSKMKDTVKNVRSEVGEFNGKDSPEYRQVNLIVKLITGQNISEHSQNKKKSGGEPVPENSPPKEFNSVSKLDFNSRLDNYKSLIGLLRSFDFYNPKDSMISIELLEALEDGLDHSLQNLSDKESTLTTEKSKILHLFDDKGGLTDRARRAKMHVARVYGKNSPEYKALVNKSY